MQVDKNNNNNNETEVDIEMFLLDQDDDDDDDDVDANNDEEEKNVEEPTPTPRHTKNKIDHLKVSRALQQRLHKVHLNEWHAKNPLYGQNGAAHYVKSRFLYLQKINPHNATDFPYPHSFVSEDPNRVVNVDGSQIRTDPNYFLNCNIEQKHAIKQRSQSLPQLPYLVKQKKKKI